MRVAGMKYKMVIAFALLAASFCFSRSAVSSPYKVYDSFKSSSFIRNGEKEELITINNKQYPVRYEDSVISDFKGETIDNYKVNESNEIIYPRSAYIKIDSKDGSLLSFDGITPYPAIANIKKLTEDEIKNAAEALLYKEIDFTVYNDFSLTYNKSAEQFDLKWQAKYDYVCNISLNLWIDSGGKICSLYLLDGCRKDFTKPFLDDSKRDELLNAKLNEKLSKYEDISEIKVSSETLSAYKGQDAINYVVEVISDQGLISVYVIVITKNY